MLSKLIFTCEVFLSLQHYLPPLLTFQARGRLCIIVAAVSLSLWGIQWQSLLARETGCLHYWLGHAVLTEIAEDILGWLACVKLACFLSITSGREFVAAACVRHHVSGCSFRLSVNYLLLLIKNFILTEKLSAASLWVCDHGDSCLVLRAIFIAGSWCLGFQLLAGSGGLQSWTNDSTIFNLVVLQGQLKMKPHAITP